jgi:hypothetical protein
LRLRSPTTLAFLAVLAVWLVGYATSQIGEGGIHPEDGAYHPIRARGDGHYYYLYTLTLALDHDVDFEDELLRFGDPFMTRNYRAGPYDLPHMRPFGSSILQLPAFMVAHGLAWVANHFGAGIAMHGYDPWHQNFVFIGNLLAAWWALVFAYRLCRRYTSEGAAAYAVLFTGLGTGVLFYAAYWSSYNHTFSILFAAWFLEYWDKTRGRWDLRRCAGLGVLLGALVLVRQQDALFAILPTVEGAFELVRRLRAGRFLGALRLLACGAVAALIASILVYPQLWVYARHFGGYFALAEGEQRLRFESPFWAESLFSSRAGLFVWAPLAWVATIGLVWARRPIAWIGLVVLALNAYANGATWAWDGGFSFGARRMLAVTPVLVLGLAFLVDHLRELHARRPRVAAHLAFALVGMTLVVMNVDLATQLVQGKASKVNADVSQPVATIYTGSLRRVARGTFWVVGNPFSWPANLVWALRHWAPPGQYDFVAGNERMYVEAHEYRKPGLAREGTVGVGSGLGVLSAGGWASAAVEIERRKVLYVGKRGRMLIPLYIEGDLGMTVFVYAPAPVRLEVWVNRQRYPLDVPAGFSEQAVPGERLHVGTNDVDVVCPTEACAAIEKVVFRYAPPG